MIKNYIKIAYRNLIRAKMYTVINLGGLSLGMTVTMLIGLWIYDELSFNQYHKNYDRIAQVLQHGTYDGQIYTQPHVPAPVGKALHTVYQADFKYIVMSTADERHVLTAGAKGLNQYGRYMEQDAPVLLSLELIKGTPDGLQDPHSILLSESVAKTFFGDADPLEQVMHIDHKLDVKVTGVYKDIPNNSTFGNTGFIAPWQLLATINPWLDRDNWMYNSFFAYVQLEDHADLATVSRKIRDMKVKNVDQERAKSRPEMLLHPMSAWHLYGEFENGVNTGGRIRFVWLFGLIGIFVLLLACINFMNLSTARSEKRAKEVGIRKAIGSQQKQLVSQFFTESILVALIAFLFSVLLVQLMLPFFNDVSGKAITLGTKPLFWLVGIGFSLFTGILAGSYPAFYLSSFQPIKVLKGTFRLGRFAAIPRKMLVIVQFTVSIALAIGVLVVFRQIQFAKSRPVGYERAGLIMIEMKGSALHDHFEAIRQELKLENAIQEMAESSSPATGVNLTLNGFSWDGSETDKDAVFATLTVSHDFGKTVGWRFKEGRDFSIAHASDSLAIVLNESAAKFMQLEDPIGKTIQFTNPIGSTSTHHVIGVIHDMLMESPYHAVSPSVYLLHKEGMYISMRLNPGMHTGDALRKIESVVKKYQPATPFEYQFVDEAYNRKFSDEERIGKLVGFFSILAVIISCLGLFGLASFVAEQRTKEIGIRKVLGASVANLWRMLCKDFVVLIVIASAIAVPIAFSFMNAWLQRYEYRTTISAGILLATCAGTLFLALLTVSFQTIKAAVANPVKSLRSE